jgi:hypothetical protein
MGSETNVWVRAVGDSRSSSFLFFSCKNSLITYTSRAAGASRHFEEAIAQHGAATENHPDVLV